MNQLLFVSETEIDAVLNSTIIDISSRAYSLSKIDNYSALFAHLQNFDKGIVLINAKANKIKAFELCRDLHDKYPKNFRVVVYLPEANASEGSAFGKLGADLEDFHSIKNFADKLSLSNEKSSKISNLTILASSAGGLGTSFFSIFLAHALGNYGPVLLSESTNNFGIAKYLDLPHSNSIFNALKSRNQNVIKDNDWFLGYLTRLIMSPKSYYLTAFNNLENKLDYDQQYSNYIFNLAEKISNSTKTESLQFKNDINFDYLAASLNLLAKELSGQSSISLCEVLSLASNFAENILWDIGNDFNSLFNQQLLEKANQVILFVQDDLKLKNDIEKYQNLFVDKYKCKLTTVMAPKHNGYHNYSKLNDTQWLELFGSKPFIMPYQPEKVYRFLEDYQDPNPNDALVKFTKEIIAHCNFSRTNSVQNKSSGVFRFLSDLERGSSCWI
ncbi:MAG: hypothetical protein LW817_02860 [Candidatus Caenarcaniphilales bacterium]|jgi:hypothetical protein|nr:hypothetical protein [Candidatus Caenarcaniphilales bacterium]